MCLPSISSVPLSLPSVPARSVRSVRHRKPSGHADTLQSLREGKQTDSPYLLGLECCNLAILSVCWKIDVLKFWTCSGWLDVVGMKSAMQLKENASFGVSRTEVTRGARASCCEVREGGIRRK